MPKSLITESLYEVPKYCFWKSKFYKCKEKVLNLIQTLTNEKKVIKPLTAFHTFCLPPKKWSSCTNSEHYQSCLQNTNANGELLLGMPRYRYSTYSYSVL